MCLYALSLSSVCIRIVTHVYATTGTWDELFEVACHNSVGFGKIPVVVLNTAGFYDGIIQQVQRAADDKACCSCDVA